MTKHAVGAVAQGYFFILFFGAALVTSVWPPAQITTWKINILSALAS